METTLPAAATTPSRRVGVVSALFYVFLWASAFAPSKILSVEAQPLWMLVIRFLIAGIVLATIALFGRRRFPANTREWLELALLGLLTNALYLGLAYISLEHLSSGIGAILASTTPLMLALLAPRLLGESLTWSKGLGLLLGFAGVLAIMVVRAGTGTAQPRDVAINVLGVLSFVFSTILFKRIQRRHDLVVATSVQLAGAGIFLIPAAAALEGSLHTVFTPAVLASLAYLIMVISIGASLLWFWLLTH